MWQSDRCGVLEAFVRRARHQQLGSQRSAVPETIGGLWDFWPWLGFTMLTLEINWTPNKGNYEIIIYYKLYYKLLDIDGYWETGRLFLHGQEPS